jgi:rhodanese-related sulfurtransferase
MQEVSAIELNTRLQQVGELPLLLDVREPHEFAYCHIEGSVNIPMNQIPMRLAELETQRETVIICHHGIRSAQTAQYLISKGFGNIINLAGGVAIWASDVDAAMPRY